jgi:O-acetyl-ADP-ribose deacetylase (regulator of RNase III)
VGRVFAAIHGAGGNSIPLDAAKHVPAPIASVVVTTAGSLPAKYIFHAITIDAKYRDKNPSKEVITAVTERCLKLLDALGASSIAFPAMGTGAAGFNYEDVAAQMAEVIADDLLKREQPIEVTIYLYDRFGRMQPMDFLRFFEELPPVPCAWRRVKQRIHQWAVGQVAPSIRCSLVIGIRIKSGWKSFRRCSSR